jgi:N-succinyldiaminopimelate aminotransferase
MLTGGPGLEGLMPRHPRLDATPGRLGGSVYSKLAPKIASLRGEVYPLHVGDTWMEPDPALSWRGLEAAAAPSPHRYCDPQGVPELLDRLVAKVRTANSIPVAGPENVLVTTGATGALTVAAGASISEGDEVLVLSPYWPLIRGIVIWAGGVPVEVPGLSEELSPEDMTNALQASITARTAAVYLSTPSNPTGRVVSPAVLEAIAAVARGHDLWIWSDEVYEDYAYSDPHHSIAALAPERTATAFSFSKAYGMAGYRCGYLVAPEPLLTAASRVATYTWYSVPTPSQLLALRALDLGSDWLQRARASYRSTGYEVAARLRVTPPGGGQFLFIDVSHVLDERGLTGFLEDCLDDNLILAPGTSFGAAFDRWVRLCFTCAEPEVTLRGVDRLARRLGV